MHKDPEMLAQLGSTIGCLYDFSDQPIQDLVKELVDEKFKLFKRTKTRTCIPAWATSKETGGVIGMLLGKDIQIKTALSISLDSSFLSLLLDPSIAEIKAYYKTHYAEDFNDYANPIKNLGEKGLQAGFDKLPMPEVSLVTYTTISSVSNLLSLDPDSQMKTVPSWNYLITEYLGLIDSKMKQAFYEMVLEMRKGLMMFMDEEIWNRIHKVKDIENLLIVEKN